MKKVVKCEENVTLAARGRRFLSFLSATVLAGVMMLGVAAPVKAAAPEYDEAGRVKYVYVKQPEVVGNTYMQYTCRDVNGNGYISQEEIFCDKYFVEDPSVVNPQTNANLFAVSYNESEYGWYNLGVYDRDVYGIRPSVAQASEMLRAQQAEDGEFYVMLKRPEIQEDNQSVRWYYWQDNDQNGYTDDNELCYYNQAITSLESVPGQPYANVYGYSDTMFVPGWEAVNVYNIETDLLMRSVETVEGQLRINETDPAYQLQLVPSNPNN